MFPRARLLRFGLVCVLTLIASACALSTKYDAAGDVHAFLMAVRDGDRKAFNSHVDRDALKTQLRARLMAEGVRRGGGGTVAALVVLLARPLADAAVDELVQPDVFRAVADYLGYSSGNAVPNRVLIAAVLKPIDDDHVCVTRGKTGACMLVFRNEGGVWRLIGFEGEISMLRPPKGL